MHGVLIPMVIDKTHLGERSYDIYSRLLKDRIIILGEEINQHVANTVIAQLLFLAKEDADKPVQLYINSPGGVITAGLAIYDTMRYIKCPVATTCIGMAASMAAVLLAGGTKGERRILPNAEVMIHQPLGGASGQASDIEIQAKQIKKYKTRLSQILAEHTGKTLKQLEKDSDRDNYMTAEEALAYGLVDEIIPHHKP